MCIFQNIAIWLLYYKHFHHTPSNLEIEKEVLTDLIKEVHMEHKGRYGARRIQLHLQQDYQQYVSIRRIGRILHHAGYFREEQEENIGNNQAIISI